MCDTAGDEVSEALGDAAVGVEPRIEDCDLQSACSVAGEQAAEYFCGFLPGDAVWVPVVHGWHQGVVEDVDVEMHPEPVKIRLGERGQRLAKSMTGACGPDFGEVDNGDGSAPDVLTEEMVVVVEDPVADQRDIFIPDQWPQFVQVGEHARTTSCCYRQVERCDFTVRLVAGMLEVGVAVKEGKSIPAPAPEGEERSEHDAAVAAQHDRKAVAVKRVIHGASSIAGDRRDPRGFKIPVSRSRTPE